MTLPENLARIVARLLHGDALYVVERKTKGDFAFWNTDAEAGEGWGEHESLRAIRKLRLRRLVFFEGRPSSWRVSLTSRGERAAKA